ncbi:hypothetical protein [Cellulomonas fimi]|uniref:hypothetical protein n=1 Tax=Cellulomonas fimi TaxID=1708 RepID=UPI00235A0C20|nr:hypothetical protein [Cellulomonas fimi]
MDELLPWAWVFLGGVLVTAMTNLAVKGTESALARVGRLAAVPFRRLVAGHRRRMVAKYGAPQPEFTHPARFEVHGEIDGNRGRTWLVNVGHGDAFGVVAAADPMSPGRVTIRGAASWSAIPSDGGRELIAVVSDVLALISDANTNTITVSWRDADGTQHEDEAPLDANATRVAASRQ